MPPAPAGAEYRAEDARGLVAGTHTQVDIIERVPARRTYAVKKEFHAYAMKIVKPVVERVKKAEAQHYGSDCAWPAII